jgi:hypothetical protein
MSKWTDLCIQLHFPLIFVSEPTYTEKILKEAFEYYKLNKSIIKLKNDNEYAYFIPAGETTELNKEKCRNYVTKMELCKFKTFSDLFDYANKIHVVKLNLNNWKNSQCNCAIWQKNYYCNHVPYVASKEPLCNFTFKDIALHLPLEKKKKRRRKDKTRPRLQHQPSQACMQPKEIQVDDENEEPHNEKKGTKRKQPEQSPQAPLKPGSNTQVSHRDLRSGKI